MSRGTRLTIMGLYNYDPDIFAGFEVPDGMDRDVVINDIVMQCAELELVYPSFNLMKLAINNWCKVESKIWDKLYNTENLEYNPIWNVDGKVIESGTRKEIGRDGRTGSNERNATDNSTRTDSTKGYNETSWLDNGKSVIAGSETESGEFSETLNRSNDVDDTREITRTGNIGVTTTQQMIREERDVAEFSTIKYIVNSFKKRFCIMIY